jgi:site-specific DNA recombinase
MGGDLMTVIRCVTYVRMSKDKAGDEHGIANQQAALDRHAEARGWTITRRLSDNDLSATSGVRRPGFDEAMRLVEAGQADVVLCWAVDRFVRRIAELESVIGRFQAAGCKLAAVSGDLDLSSDAGRTVARMLSVIAQGEVERKSERQKLASSEAAAAGKRWTGCPRPFGFGADHVTHEPAEAAAIRDAVAALLGGSTISAVAREWNARGLRSTQTGKALTRSSVNTILRNPRLAGHSVYRGEIVGTGQWDAIVNLGQWEAVCRLLDAKDRTIVDKHGKTRRVRLRTEAGVRTLLGGVARCQCGNTVQGTHSSRGAQIYRCDPEKRNGQEGPHVSQRIGPVGKHLAADEIFVDEHVIRVVCGMLSRDSADLITPSGRTLRRCTPRRPRSGPGLTGWPPTAR